MGLLLAVVSLLVGTAYVGLAVLTAYEMVACRRDRGPSHLGMGLVAMGITCGAHHLIHGEHVLASQQPVTALALVPMLVSAVPGGLFVLLRLEAASGGRGDRFVSGTPLWLASAPVALGLMLGWIATHWYQVRPQFDPTVLVVNLVLGACYMLVSADILRTQLDRRLLIGGWSASGLSMGGLFATCAVTHVTFGLTVVPDDHTAALGAVSIPAAIWFLSAVRNVHRGAARDWQRPVVGSALLPPRPSPWTGRPVRTDVVAARDAERDQTSGGGTSRPDRRRPSSMAPTTTSSTEIRA